MSARHVVAAVALSLVLGAAGAATLADVRSAFSDLRDGKSTPATAAAVAQAFRHDNRGSPLAMAYLGSVRAIQAERAAVPWRKLNYLDESFDLLDQAVEMLAQPHVSEAVAVEVLLVSAVTNASLPKLFRRRAAARASFESLLARRGFAQLEGPVQAIAYAWLAVLISETQPETGAAYLAQARRLNTQLADNIWSKR